MKPTFSSPAGGQLPGQGAHCRRPRRLAAAPRLRVRLRKLDPYLNVDPGTMSPFQHGEVFVPDDGAETDLDLGHYERFTSVPARADRQRLGRPHLLDGADQRAPRRLSGQDRAGDPPRHERHQGAHQQDVEEADIVLVEIGGTVGDIEGLPFLEAIRQFGNELPRDASPTSTPPWCPTCPPRAS